MSDLQLIDNDGVVQLHGELSFATVAQINREFVQLSEIPNTVDLHSVSKIDSAGLALLLEWYKRASISKASIQFRNSPKELSSLASLANLGHLFGLSE